MFDLIDIEQAVLASILTEEKWQEYIEKLDESDFQNSKHKKILRAMKKIREAGGTIDIVNTYEQLKEEGVQLTAHITEMVANLPTAANFEEYFRQLKARSARKQLLEAGRKIAIMAKQSKDVDILELKNDALQLISDIEIDAVREEDNSLKSVMLEVFDDLERKYEKRNDTSYYTGICDLDRVTGGLHEEELTVIAARPGVGKTAFALQIAEKIASKGRKVLFISREMSRIQLGLRMIIRHTKLDGTKLRTGKISDEAWEKISTAIGPLSELPIWIDQNARTTQEVRAVARELKNKNGLDLVIIDYLQLLKTTEKYQNREQEVAAMSRDIKLLTNEFKIPIILLAQLNRQAEGRRPALSDLRESGAIEQDADNVLFLYKLSRKEIEKMKGRQRNIAEQVVSKGADFVELIIAKQRNGPLGTVYLGYMPSRLMFQNLTDRSA